MQNNDTIHVINACVATFLSVAILTTGGSSTSAAQTGADSTKAKATAVREIGGKFRAQASIIGGLGLKNMKV